MSNRNNRNSLMSKRVAASVLIAVFVIVSLASPVIAQTSTDAVLILHFDEGSGTIVKDESGRGNDGTIYGATWTEGISGKALSFDGVDDYVDCGSDTFDNIGAAVTVEAWIKPTDANGNVFEGGQTNDYNDFFRFQVYGGKVQFALRTGSATRYDIRTDNNARTGSEIIFTGVWQHLVGVADGVNAPKIYLNGVEQSTIQLVSPDYTKGLGDMVGTGNKYFIGKEKTDNLNRFFFNGIIDEVAIYNRALSAEEVEAIYLAKRAGGSTEESASELISSVSTRIDALKRSDVDTSLIEQALKNSQNDYDLGNHDEAYELAQSALKMADDAYEAQQHIESAQSEIDDAESIGAEVKDAEAKLKEAKDALNKGNYEYAQDWADDASELAKRASIGSVQINDLKALATKYDQRTVVISGTIRDIETVYGEGYKFALDDGSSMISVTYQGSLGDIKDGDKVTASGIFEASTGTLVADNVQKSGVGGGGVPGFEVIFAIAGLLAVVYVLRRGRER
ncbi:hypothetical protein C5S31_08300 [ANME-1 cluster archaeon GoMg2]|nr:hypothetical protein [ANME-1 cluster archaeon GoMg2]